MVAYDLIDLLNDAHESQYIIEFINELIGEIESNPKKLVIELSNEIEDYAVDIHNLCPLCGSKLKTIEHIEDRGEYQGFNCGEIIYTRECSECTYVVE